MNTSGNSARIILRHNPSQRRRRATGGVAAMPSLPVSNARTESCGVLCVKGTDSRRSDSVSRSCMFPDPMGIPGDVRRSIEISLCVVVRQPGGFTQDQTTGAQESRNNASRDSRSLAFCIAQISESRRHPGSAALPFYQSTNGTELCSYASLRCSDPSAPFPRGGVAKVGEGL